MSDVDKIKPFYHNFIVEDVLCALIEARNLLTEYQIRPSLIEPKESLRVMTLLREQIHSLSLFIKENGYDKGRTDRKDSGIGN